MNLAPQLFVKYRVSFCGVNAVNCQFFVCVLSEPHFFTSNVQRFEYNFHCTTILTIKMSEDDPKDHSRVIIHIDMDCFYAQVEMNKNPDLRNVPMGVYQKRFVITSNYLAREKGVKKCMFIPEVKELCPEIVLVNGEDLYDYRQASYKVTNFCHQYTSLVERLGLDENFLDVTLLVEERLKKGTSENDRQEVVGHVFGDVSEQCVCGCFEKLRVGSVIAQEIREAIRKEFNLTTCGGIAHNKLLAKLVGSRHKPNQQTTIFPNSALELILSLNSLGDIPGIGRAMQEQLETINIQTIDDLQNTERKILENLLGVEKAHFVLNLINGIDPSLVKPTGKPQSIGLEDACKTISIEKEVRNKLQQLLSRLLLLVSEDGRIPKTIKLTIRKFDMKNKVSHRETRQCNINPSSFKNNQPNEPKIMISVMHLFNRVIDVKKPYHITLLGLSFTKFQEASNIKNSIAYFLKKDIEVQSVISIQNRNEIKEATSPIPSSSSYIVKDIEESPTSTKKLKLTNLVSKKRCFEDFYEDCESPSKLKVADLCLESVSCPPDADQDVFKELPVELQKELWSDYKRRTAERNFCSNQVKKAKSNSLLNYFIRN